MNANFERILTAAKARVIALSDPFNFRTHYQYICLVDGDYARLNEAEYEEFGDEDKCVSAVWSYRDGEYNDQNQFIHNGKCAAAAEFYNE